MERNRQLEPHDLWQRILTTKAILKHVACGHLSKYPCLILEKGHVYRSNLEAQSNCTTTRGSHLHILDQHDVTLCLFYCTFGEHSASRMKMTFLVTLNREEGMNWCFLEGIPPPQNQPWCGSRMLSHSEGCDSLMSLSLLPAEHERRCASVCFYWFLFCCCWFCKKKFLIQVATSPLNPKK